MLPSPAVVDEPIATILACLRLRLRSKRCRPCSNGIGTTGICEGSLSMVTAMLLPRQGELEENSAAREDCQRMLRDLIRFARRTDREWSRMDKQNSWVYRVRKSRVWFTGPGDDTGMYSRYTF